MGNATTQANTSGNQSGRPSASPTTAAFAPAMRQITAISRVATTEREDWRSRMASRMASAVLMGGYGTLNAS
jgi:hypothetical protein